MNNLNIRRPFSALMNLSHLVRAFDFTLTGFLTKLIYMFFKSKVTINCYAKKLFTRTTLYYGTFDINGFYLKRR